MDLRWAVVVVCFAFFSCVTASPISMGPDIEHLVLRRNLDSENSTDDTTEPSTGPTQDPSIFRLVEILAGSLVAAVVVALALGIVVIVLVVRGLQLRQRRREQRDVVLRMKHDIFEGVSNAVVTFKDSDENVPVHNVIDSSPERTVECSNDQCDEGSTAPVIES